MKRIPFYLIPLFIFSLIVVSCNTTTDEITQPEVQKTTLAKKGVTGVTIQDGIIQYQPGHYLAGTPLKTGFDIFGYNYQSHMFSGSYANCYLGADGYPPYSGDDESYLALYPGAASKWYWPYRNDHLDMKWNDAWLSNRDCDGDGKLDRHYGFTSYIGSGAWLTNHQSGTYYDNDKLCKWNYYVKIIAVPADAYKVSGTWYNAGGIEIGPVIWGEFAIVLEVSNDPNNGDHGQSFKSADRPSLGGW